MKNRNEKSNNKLGFNLFDAEADFQRHPSIKNLYDEKGNLMTPSQCNNEYFFLNIKKKHEKSSKDTNISNKKKEGNEKEKESDKKNNQNSKMSVQINRVKEKAVDYKDTFYVEMNDEEKKNIVKQKKDKENSSEPLNYEFNDKQKKFDKDITDAMSKGEEYTKIEEKFSDQLKKK